jgi:hypothetical protein
MSDDNNDESAFGLVTDGSEPIRAAATAYFPAPGTTVEITCPACRGRMVVTADHKANCVDCGLSMVTQISVDMLGGLPSMTVAGSAIEDGAAAVMRAVQNMPPTDYGPSPDSCPKRWSDLRGVWNFTADELDILGLKPGDTLGPGIVGDPL